jgi:murein DD-endopeptidase MepM/ murein hydrolase activator NlpD
MVQSVWAAALPQPLWSEPFLQPLEGRNTSGYGDARTYAPGGNVSYHQGADLAAPAGTVIHATNAGVAVIAADYPTYPIKGGLVIIDHGGGVMSYYLHQSRVLIEQGALVSRGQPIGEVGTTGLSTGPHLHWELRINNVATNPLLWVGKLFP